MIPDDAVPWQENGAHVATRALSPSHFIDQHVSPLFFRHTQSVPVVRDCEEIVSEGQFWGNSGKVVFGEVRISGFTLTDWFPRAPGVYWSGRARRARKSVWSGPSNTDAELGEYFSPESKMGLIEDGGIGTIRLRPRRIDNKDCWLATALTGMECHCGIPLAIPHQLLLEAGVSWGDHVNLQGRVRYLQDAGLDDTAAYVHHARPLIVFVEELKGVATRRSRRPIVITPVALFEEEGPDSRRHRFDVKAQYTFVQCLAGADTELDEAGDWIEKYARKYAGRVITNFDEQRPFLADAPLSYQRLVAKTYDKTVIERFTGTILVDKIDRVVQETVTSQYFGDVHMGHNINVGGPAIINIDAVLTNVTQTIGNAPGLDPTQKSELESLVQTMKKELDQLKASHSDETKEIAEALEKAVANASKPPAERKQSLLQLSAKGLKDAAELVKDTAPSLLATARLIANFIVGL
jgi:hypothetical protein